MSHPFDATMKDLGRDYPRDYVAAFDAPPTLPVSLLNVDLSTVTTAADLVVGLGNPLQEIVHLDFQASASATKHGDILVYHSLLFAHYRVPVHSIVVLLRPQAAHSNLNGTVRYSARPGRGKMEFSYEVIRLWEHPAEAFLTASLGILPLAVLGQTAEGVPLEEGLAGIVQSLIDRLTREATPEQARKLLASAFTLAGLRLRRDAVRRLFQGVRAMPVDMRDSDTYLAIMDEGREAQVKNDILLLGAQRFGAADQVVTTRLAALSDLDRLNRMVGRLLAASSWQDLLDTP
jgi:hypothetical protein